MKLQILSDLHLEFGGFTPPATDADVIVLAGDIHIGAKGVIWAQQHFQKPVIYVPGNHEHYGGSFSKTVAAIRAAAASSNVHVLDGDTETIDGVRFVGATLWTDFRLTGNQPLAQWDAQQTLSDYKKVRNDRYSKIRPYEVLQRHSSARFFIEGQLQVPFDGPTVVVTHHAPTAQSIHPRYRDIGDHLSAAYASNLEHLLQDGLPAAWIHGHTHDSLDIDMYGTRILCNPRGYAPKDLNREFNPSLVVEV